MRLTLWQQPCSFCSFCFLQFQIYFCRSFSLYRLFYCFIISYLHSFVNTKKVELNAKIITACFRDKTDYLWSECKETLSAISFSECTPKKYSADEYAKTYYDHESMRPSCYQCKFTNLSRPGDITLGDFWGVKESHPDIYDELGISFVMKNTEKGDKLIRMLYERGDVFSAKVCETKQPQLYKPVRKPVTRKWFWRAYNARGMGYILYKNSQKCSFINIVRTLIHIGKCMLKKLVRISKK